MFGSVDLLRMYIYIFNWERCNPYSACVRLARKLWWSFRYNSVPSTLLNGLFYYKSIG